MSFFRDKPRLSDRLKGKTTNEIIDELRNDFKQDDSEKSSFFNRPSTNRTNKFGPSPSARFFNRSGFPFDDDASDVLRGGRTTTTDIRTHLDDLARRHPDLADQLRGFPGGGGDIVGEPESGGVFENGAASRKESSTGTAAEGGSSATTNCEGETKNGVSEPCEQKNGAGDDNNSGDGGRGHSNEEPKRDKIGNLQNHGLRNTVPLVDPKSASGLKMNNESQEPRGSRAQSAPPQNSNEPQTFISKIEIQPTNNGHASETSNMNEAGNGPTNNENQAPIGQNQQHAPLHHNEQHQEASKPPPVKQPNVRHIPIFVEGRDVPIVNRDHEPSSFHHQPQHHPHYREPSSSPPNAHPFDHVRYREPPSSFEPSYGPSSDHHTSSFGGAGGGGFYDIPVQHVKTSGGGGGGSYRAPSQFGGSTFSKPKHQPQQQQQQQAPNEKVHRVFHQAQNADPSSHGFHQRTQNQTQQSGGPQNYPEGSPQGGGTRAGPQQPQDAPDGHAPSPPPKKISKPKTPLELIQEVQGEVDKLKLQIQEYKGTSRSEKEYIYLDEMLTRELLKLDNIDSGGNEEIRTLRRSTIKNIQNTIASLEAKVPLSGGESSSSTPSQSGEPGGDGGETADSSQPMDVEQPAPGGGASVVLGGGDGQQESSGGDGASNETKDTTTQAGNVTSSTTEEKPSEQSAPPPQGGQPTSQQSSGQK